MSAAPARAGSGAACALRISGVVVAILPRAYYTTAHGDGQTQGRAHDRAVDPDDGSAAPGVSSVLSTAERGAAPRRLRHVRRTSVSEILCRSDGSAESAARGVFPPVADWLFRGSRLGARHRVAGERLARLA